MSRRRVMIRGRGASLLFLAGFLLVACSAAFLMWNSPGGMQVTHRGMTLDAVAGRLAVFEVVNHSQVPLVSSQGLYERRTALGWSHGAGDSGADVGGVK